MCVCARERERERERETGNAIVLILGYVWRYNCVKFTVERDSIRSAYPGIRIPPSVYPQAVCKRNRDGDGVNGS